MDTEQQRRPPAQHLVHFFVTDDGLVEAVGGYLTASVLDGDGVVIIATESHCDGFRNAFVAAGVDVDEVERSGRMRMLDAADTLRTFMTDGGVDAAAFNTVVGGLIEDVAASGREVRAYGEMVALLWAAGDVQGAMELEGLWNDLGANLPFTLFCAYPASSFDDASAAESFGHICQLHSEVVAGAPHPGDADVLRRFPRTPHAPRLARQFVRETLASWSAPEDTIDDALLVASELVTNAILHGESDVAVGLTLQADGVRVLVSDTSAQAPATLDLERESPSGRGLAMIRAIATDWGHRSLEAGKLVWADLRSEGKEGRR